MLTNLDPSSEIFLADMGRVQERLRDASRQVSSGKRITAPSDAPDEIAPLLQLRTQFARNTQVQQNLGLAKTDADSAESALNSAAKLMDRAISLAAQGGSFTEESSRQSLAADVQAIQEQMLAYSRTSVDGRYIFSGGDDGSPAYELDLTADNGVFQLSDAPLTRVVEDPSGGSFAAGQSARDIFDQRNDDNTFASGNVFVALNTLRVALQDNDTAGIQNSMDSLKAASVHLNTSLAFYGNTQTRIADATSFAAAYSTRIQTEIGQKEDADVAAAAMNLTQANTQLQAAFQMHANMPRKTLFDFLA